MPPHASIRSVLMARLQPCGRRIRAMRMIRKIFAGTAGMAALAAAAPAAAQYDPYNSYGYGMNSDMAARQCTAAVQNRLYNRTSLGSIFGSFVGVPTRPAGHVLSITSSIPTRFGMRLRGLATSGRRYAYNDYGEYGYGAYGALGYGYGYGRAADLSWR